MRRGYASLSGRQAFRKDAKFTTEFKQADLKEIESSKEPLDVGSYASLLRQCNNPGSLNAGKHIHTHISRFTRDPGTFLSNLLVQMYANCGSLGEARAVFDRIAHKNVFSWNILIAAYTQTGHLQEASILFERMMERDHITWTALMNAYAGSGNLSQARVLFDMIPQRDVVTWSTMIAANAKKGHLDEAQLLFDEMPLKNIVAWTALLTAYAQIGHGKKAVSLFKHMELEGLKANDVTFLCVLDACCCPVNLFEGRAVHCRLLETEFVDQLKIGNALIGMYGKCGSYQDARHVFDTMCRRDVVSWNGLLEAYAQNDLKSFVPGIYRLMELDGQFPNEITLISVLSACSHAGLLDDGYQFFASLYDYGMVPAIDHYVCMIDLLGRVGDILGAIDLIKNMPYYPDAVAWRAVLSACKVHRELQLAAHAGEAALELDQLHAGSYLLVSNALHEIEQLVRKANLLFGR